MKASPMLKHPILKRLLMTAAIMATPLAAQASPELAKDWGAQAAILSLETTGLITSIDRDETAIASDDYYIRLDKFARTSATLGKWIDATDGPHDLGCIFRGMKVEASTQGEALDIAQENTAKRATLKRLATMFADADMISEAASRRAATPTLKHTSDTDGCPFSSEAAMAALK